MAALRLERTRRRQFFEWRRRLDSRGTRGKKERKEDGEEANERQTGTRGGQRQRVEGGRGVEDKPD